MQNKNELINWKLQQLYTINTNLSLDKVEKKTFERSFLEFKLKILHDPKYFNNKIVSKPEMYINKLLTQELEMRQVLKIIYTISFQDILGQDQFKRSIINSLKNGHLYEDRQNNQSFLENSKVGIDSYIKTIWINNLYYLYKIKNEHI